MATYMFLEHSPNRMMWTVILAVIGVVIGAGVAFLGHSRGGKLPPPTHRGSLEHEIKKHGISPAGQAVGDPDAPASSPSDPIDSRIP